MIWLLRRLLGPFVIGSIVCATLLLLWTWTTEIEASARLPDAALAFLFMLPFQAVGLILLLPLALALGNRTLRVRFYPVLLALIGSVLGVVVVLPIMDAPSFLEIALAATCGAVSAIVWFVINLDVARP